MSGTQLWVFKSSYSFNVKCPELRYLAMGFKRYPFMGDLVNLKVLSEVWEISC